MSKSDRKIYEYFTKLRTNKEPIPYISQAAKEAKVSVATLSRYSTKKGYSNFAVLREDYHKKRDAYRRRDAQMDTLIKFIHESTSLYIIPSNTCISLGFHLRERLENLGYTVNLRPYSSNKKEALLNIPKNAHIIHISVSATSGWYEEFIALKLKQPSLIICTQEPVKKSKRVIELVHLDKSPIKATSFEQNISRGKLLHWIDQAITQLQLEIINNKKNK